MKKLRGSTPVKVLAILLLVALALCLGACVLGGVFLYDLGAYNGGTSEELLDRLGQSKLRSAMAMVSERLLYDPELKDTDGLNFVLFDDFRYTLTDEDGKTLVGQTEGETVLWSGTGRLKYVAEYQETTETETLYRINVAGYDDQNSVWWGNTIQNSVPLYINKPLVEYLGTPPEEYDRGSTKYGYSSFPPVSGEEEDVKEDGTKKIPEIPAGYREPPQEDLVYTYTLTGCLIAPLTGWDQILMDLYNTLQPVRYALLWGALGALLLCVLLFVFLMCAAGHRGGGDEVVPNFSDKLPSDLFAAAVGAGTCWCAYFSIEILDEAVGVQSFDPFFFTCGVLLLVAGLLLAVWLCMGFATRLKLGTVIKNSLCWKLLVWAWRIARAVLGWCWRAVRGFFRVLKLFLRKIPLLWKAILFVAVLLFAELIVIMSTEYDLGVEVVLWFLRSAALSLAFFYAILCLRRLQRGIKEIANGNENTVVDTRYLRGDFKDSAEDLNHIREGMVRAVNERMKSERFKTELITNVSHDIKTPLTSIINYVDLLEKEQPENEKMREYIEVLSRQSARLKKLIDDLIEASKASTGNLSVNLEHCELGVLLDQTVGEYAEKLAAAGLELVVKKPEEPVTVLADGRHTWRIFDNLMNNVCKYAQPGTRVYLNLEREGRKALVTFRNISRSQLNISGDELMERFVRGDTSRNTEGSGLGLSIARSLAQLQGSQLELTVDGDLFKVALRFDTTN